MIVSITLNLIIVSIMIVVNHLKILVPYIGFKATIYGSYNRHKENVDTNTHPIHIFCVAKTHAKTKRCKCNTHLYIQSQVYICSSINQHTILILFNIKN